MSYTPLHAFTLFETLLVLSILSVCTSLAIENGIPTYMLMSARLDSMLLLAGIREARAESMQNVDDSAHGIYIDSSHTVIFSGQSYASRDNADDLQLPFLTTEQILDSQGAPTTSIQISFQQTSGMASIPESFSFRDSNQKASLHLFQISSDGSITSL